MSFTISANIGSDVFHAWEYYFNQINGWWPKEFFTSSKTKRFVIETVIGGKLYEDHGEGCGLIWGEVLGVDYPNSLQLKGFLTREFGGPVFTYEKFTFLPENGGSKITYQVDFIGKIDQERMDALKQSWTELLQTHFVNYCKDRE